METPKGGHPPKWWVKVIKDLEQATKVSQDTFKTPGIVIGFSENSDGEKQGILVRLKNGEVGYYSGKGDLPPVGSKIKNDLPLPEVIVKEPKLISFVFEVIRGQIKLLPNLWLRKVLTKMLEGKPVTMVDDLKPFPDWVKLSVKMKKDKALIDVLYRVTRYEGLKGLERFNDKAQ